MYDNTQYSDAERTAKKRRLNMDSISYESDLKRNLRDQDEINIDIRRYKQDIDRLRISIGEKEVAEKKLKEKEVFIRGQMSRIKKELINLK